MCFNIVAFCKMRYVKHFFKFYFIFVFFSQVSPKNTGNNINKIKYTNMLQY